MHPHWQPAHHVLYTSQWSRPRRYIWVYGQRAQFKHSSKPMNAAFCCARSAIHLRNLYGAVHPNPTSRTGPGGKMIVPRNVHVIPRNLNVRAYVTVRHSILQGCQSPHYPAISLSTAAATAAAASSPRIVRARARAGGRHAANLVFNVAGGHSKPFCARLRRRRCAKARGTSTEQQCSKHTGICISFSPSLSPPCSRLLPPSRGAFQPPLH